MSDDRPAPSTPHQRYAGPERRRWSREKPTSGRVIGYARVRPEATRHLHRLTAGVWYPVRDRNPGELRPEPLAGYVWVEVHGRLEHIYAKHVEVRSDRPDPAW